jgi:hypothetical protein
MAETNTTSPATAKTIEPTNAVAPASTNTEIKPLPTQAKPQPINAVAVNQTNVAPQPQTNHIATAPPILPANPVAPANAALPPEDSGLNRTAAFAIAAAALLAAIVVAVFFIFRARRKDRGSLISRSMRNP